MKRSIKRYRVSSFLRNIFHACLSRAAISLITLAGDYFSTIYTIYYTTRALSSGASGYAGSIMSSPVLKNFSIDCFAGGRILILSALYFRMCPCMFCRHHSRSPYHFYTNIVQNFSSISRVKSQSMRAAHTRIMARLVIPLGPQTMSEPDWFVPYCSGGG